MAILDQIRDRRGVFTDLVDVVDELRKQTNGNHPGDLAEDATSVASNVATAVSEAANGVSTAALDTAKDVTDGTRDRIDGLGELLRDLAREWSKASGDMRLDERFDEIAQRLRAAMPAATFKGAVARLERELPDTDKDRYDRAFERGRVRTRSIYVAGGLAAGVAAGLVGAMLLDPQRGAERRARIARMKDDAATRVSARTRGLTERAKSMAAERGIGQPKAVDPTGVTTGRDMVPVMPVGDGLVGDPSSIVREPLPDSSGLVQASPGSDIAAAVDATVDRSVTATHG